MLRGPKTIALIVSFHSYSWIRQCISGFVKHCSDIPLLVLDNNRSKQDDANREFSFKFSWIRIEYSNYLVQSERERDWLKKQPQVILVRTPRFLYHGDAINYAMSWCADRHIQYLVHIEPDCLVFGSKWLDSLKNAIDGNWMASGHKFNFGPLHPTPSIWLVKKARHLDFLHKSKDELPPPSDYKRYIDEDLMSTTNFCKDYWDVGQYAWYLCARRGKARYVEVNDIVHFWRGTSTGGMKI